MESDAKIRERFLALVDQQGAALRRFCLGYCDGQTEAQDLFQEIALAVWTALPRFRGECSERTWLYRIAHNVALTFRFQARRQTGREVPMESGIDTLPSMECGIESYLLQAEKQQMLRALVRQLHLQDRRLVLLYMEGLSTAEIEAVTGLRGGNIAVRLTRIRQALSSRMQGTKARAVKS